MTEKILVLGIVLSILFYECTRLSPGGIIVPGYFALCLTTPLRIGYTLVLVLLTWALLRGLSNLFILYGKRRFALAIIRLFKTMLHERPLFALAIVLSYLLNLAVVATGLLPFPVGVIGLIVPGIMVREMEKQGVGKTLLALAAVTGILAAVMLLMGAL